MMTSNEAAIAVGETWRIAETAFEFQSRRFSGQELGGLADRRSRFLTDQGIERGSDVLVVMDNSPDVVISVLALWQLGAVVVPVPPRDSQKAKAGPWHELYRRASLTGAEYVVGAGGSLKIDGLKRIDVTQDLDYSTSERATVRARSSDLAVIQFSSGSTGEPKPIFLTHENMEANAAAIASRLGLDEQTVGYCWLPLHHDMGLMGGLVATLLAGGRFVLSTPRSFALDPIGWLVDCADTGATFTGGPPFAYRLVLDRLNRSARRLDGRSLSSIRTAIIGSERVTSSLYNEFETALKPFDWRAGALCSAYGLAENTVAAAMSEPLRVPNATVISDDRTALVRSIENDELATFVSCGKPMDGTVIQVLSEDGAPRGSGQIGDIWIGGTSAGRSNRSSISGDGLVPTGDLGAIVDGELYVVGRSRELIKSAGRSFAPQDLEDELREALPEVYAIGVSSEVSQQHATELLYVVVEVGPRFEHDLAAVRRTVNIALANGFGLRAHEVTTARPGAVPRTSSGKLRRSEIPRVVRSSRHAAA